MQRFKNILVMAHDSSDTTLELLELGVQLARRNHSRLTLFDAIEAPVGRLAKLLGERPGSQLTDAMAEARADELRSYAAHHTELAIDIGVAVGSTFVEAIRRVDEVGHDLVMIAPERLRSGGGLVGSSTTMHLLRKSPVPVWVHESGASSSADVAVAVGPFDLDEGPTALDHTLVQLASSLASRRGGRLHVIHAWRVPGETLLRSSRVGADPSEVDAMADAMREAALITLDGLVAEAAEFDVPIELYAHKGRAGEVIPAVVAEVRPGALVIGTLARRGIPGVIIGNTAEWVFSQIDTSILAVKHPGFRSPLLG